MPGIVTSSTIASGAASTARSTAWSPRVGARDAEPCRAGSSARAAARSPDRRRRRARDGSGRCIERGYRPRRARLPREAPNGPVARLGRAAPVAQGIERRPPEPGAQVRILPGAPDGPYDADDERSARRCTRRPGSTRTDRSTATTCSTIPSSSSDAWLGDAEAAGVPLPNAMALATADGEAVRAVRHVLLRGVDGAASSSSRTVRAARAGSSPRTRGPASSSSGRSSTVRCTSTGP